MPAPTVASVDTPLGPVSYSDHRDGAPLLLLHSLLTDRRAFDRVVADLPGRVVALDLPGFGNTALTGPSIESYADLMSAGAQAICADDGAITVMGNGLGAFVALGMAVANGSMLDRLVLVGCGTTFPEDAKPAFSAMIGAVDTGGMAAVTPTALRRIFTEEYLATHPDEVEERSRVLAGTDPEAFMTACRALQEVDFSDGVGGVETPTLIVVGEDDQATPPAMARGLHHSLPDSELVILPRVAHAPQIQEPSAFVNAVKTFLERE